METSTFVAIALQLLSVPMGQPANVDHWTHFHDRVTIEARGSSAGLAVLVEPVDTPSSPAMPRVRDIGDATVATLIHEARDHSATFRRLLERIDHTDGLVYVERGRCAAGLRGCLLMTVMVSGPHRVLRIHIDVTRNHATVIGALGHELQHAIEVLGERGIRSDALMYVFYSSLAGTPSVRLGKLAFETEAAVEVGDQVQSEYEASVKTR